MASNKTFKLQHKSVARNILCTSRGLFRPCQTSKDGDGGLQLVRVKKRSPLVFFKKALDL